MKRQRLFTVRLWTSLQAKLAKVLADYIACFLKRYSYMLFPVWPGVRLGSIEIKLAVLVRYPFFRECYVEQPARLGVIGERVVFAVVEVYRHSRGIQARPILIFHFLNQIIIVAAVAACKTEHVRVHECEPHRTAPSE